jgi:hypothetical protein
MIEIKTKYTKESLENYFRFIATRNAVRTAIIFLLAVALLLAVSIGMAMADETDDMEVPLEALLFVFGIAILIVLIFCYIGDFILKPKTNTKAALKSNPQLLETELCLTFYEAHYLTIYAGGLISGTLETKYEAILIAYEVKDYFYLHVKQNNLLIIDKRDFTQGTPEEFTALLKKVMPDKKVKIRIK